MTLDQTVAKDSLRDVLHEPDGLTTRLAARHVFPRLRIARRGIGSSEIRLVQIDGPKSQHERLDYVGFFPVHRLNRARIQAIHSDGGNFRGLLVHLPFEPRVQICGTPLSVMVVPGA